MGDKKLFSVSLELEFYVLASSEAEAIDDWKERMREQLGNVHKLQLSVCESPEYVDENWYDETPYNGDGGKTCGELAREQRETAEFDKRQIKMF